jgi:hypothetical protein
MASSLNILAKLEIKPAFEFCGQILSGDKQIDASYTRLVDGLLNFIAAADQLCGTQMV